MQTLLSIFSVPLVLICLNLTHISGDKWKLSVKVKEHQCGLLTGGLDLTFEEPFDGSRPDSTTLFSINDNDSIVVDSMGNIWSYWSTTVVFSDSTQVDGYTYQILVDRYYCSGTWDGNQLEYFVEAGSGWVCD